MKITKITPYLVSAPAPFLPTAENSGGERNREYLFVEVNTDEGVTGWGEVTCTREQANRTVASMVRHVSDLLEGDDPKNIEKIWHKVFRHFTYMGSRGATTSVLSGIDIALWDIRGKVLGVPVYELLGGPVRDAVDVYCHPQNGVTADELAQECKAIVATGQTSLKTDPWFPHHPEEIDGYMSGRLTAESENLGVEKIAAAREAVGPDIEILIDNHARFDVPTAIRLAKSLEPYNIFWFEEPVGVESNTALKQVTGRDERADLRRRADSHSLGVRADIGAGLGGLHHAGHHLDGRHIGVEEDLRSGGELLHPSVAARC